jgi:hypothetical protein
MFVSNVTSQEGGMPGMPYHLEKGRWGAVLEDYLNGGDTPDRALETLMHLRDPDRPPVSDLGFFDAPALDYDSDERYGNVRVRRRHFDIDWFGRRPGGQGIAALNAQPSWPDLIRSQLEGDALATWDTIVSEADAGARQSASSAGDSAQPSPGARRMSAIIDAAVKKGLLDEVGRYPETGFWNQYYGDVEGIVRETFASAIEVALGLTRVQGANRELLKEYRAGKSTPCRLPIEVFWKCPQRWFEGWVTWRYDRSDDNDGRGQVTVLIASPGSGTPLLERPDLGRGALRVTGLLSEGAAATRFLARPIGTDIGLAAKGMWVVSHEDHMLLDPPNTWKGSQHGKWRIPPFGPSYVGIGDIVVVQPSEADGGVFPDGVRYDQRSVPERKRAEATEAT